MTLSNKEWEKRKVHSEAALHYVQLLNTAIGNARTHINRRGGLRAGVDKLVKIERLAKSLTTEVQRERQRINTALARLDPEAMKHYDGLPSLPILQGEEE